MFSICHHSLYHKEERETSSGVCKSSSGYCSFTTSLLLTQSLQLYLPVSITHSFGCLPFSLHQSCFYQGHQPLFHIQQSILPLIIQQHLTSFAPGSQPTTLPWFSLLFHQLFSPFPTFACGAPGLSPQLPPFLLDLHPLPRCPSPISKT